MTCVGDIITVTQYFDMPDGSRKSVPYFEVDPGTRKAMRKPQQFRVTSVRSDGTPNELAPVHGVTS